MCCTSRNSKHGPQGYLHATVQKKWPNDSLRAQLLLLTSFEVSASGTMPGASTAQVFAESASAQSAGGLAMGTVSFRVRGSKAVAPVQTKQYH